MQNIYAKRVEVLQFMREDPLNNEWLRFQLAVDERLAPEFSVHKADLAEYRDEQKLIDMLTRQSIGLLDEFGDARYAHIAA